MRVSFAPLLLTLALAALPAGGASAQDDAEFNGLLQRQLITTLAVPCVREHPGLRTEIDRVREGWLAKNAKVLAELDARYAALPKARQKAIFDNIQKMNAHGLGFVEEGEAAGQGELTCRKLFAAYDAMPALALPAAAPNKP